MKELPPASVRAAADVLRGSLPPPASLEFVETMLGESWRAAFARGLGAPAAPRAAVSEVEARWGPVPAVVRARAVRALLGLEPQPFEDAGRFVNLGEVGRGAWGVVYLVYDAELARECALKTLRPELAREAVGLKDEFRTLKNLVHDNVVRLEELFHETWGVYFTMEYVPGESFVSAARRSSDVGGDLGRFTRLARQLVSAVSAIHGTRHIHRDIKPENVRVTAEDRVVLLDFGLTVPREGDPLREVGGIAGTLPYIAPEQFLGQGASEAADVYSVGVVLFEALTGVCPFRGNGIEVSVQKRRPPRRVAEVWPAAPPVLAGVVDAMLAIAPRDRPRLAVIAEALGGVADPELPEVWVGRHDELAQLRAVIESRGPSIVQVVGPSGVGKSSLIDRLLSGLRGAVLALRGYCHPRELVPFNGLDAAIDGLASFLAREEHRVHVRGLPGAAELGRLFPALAESLAVDASDADQDDPRVARRRALEALQALLARIAAVLPVVVVIDDAQWCDLDSIDALSALVSLGRAPAITLVLVSRSEDAGSPALKALQEPTFGVDSVYRWSTIEVAPLDVQRARELAAVLAPSRTSAELDHIVTDAGGSPLFVNLLATHAGPQPPSVEGVLSERLARLSTAGRDVLRATALAAWPAARDEVLRALELGETSRAVVGELERARLLRRAPDRERGQGPVSVMYHDRIRAAVVSDMAPEVRAGLHRRLLEVLEPAETRDFDALAVHAVGAGDGPRATRYAEVAGDQARGALAFSRAADLYDVALQHADPGELGRCASLRTRAGEALKNAGRGRDAARWYLDASEALAKLGEHDQARAARRHAAVELVRAGDLDDGLRIQTEVLSGLGIRLPTSPALALAWALVRRMWLGLRPGLLRASRWAPTAPRPPLTLREQVRLDTLWEAANSLGTLNFALADAPGTQHLLEALRSRDPTRILRALTQEAAYQVHMYRGGAAARGRRMLARAEGIVADGAPAYDRAWHAMGSAMVAWASGEWTAAAAHAARAEKVYLDECAAVSWELGLTRLYGFSAAWFRGDLVLLSRRLDESLYEALGRGDLNAANNYRLGHMSLARLCRDRRAEVAEHLAEAEARWPATVFHTQQYHHLVLAVNAHVYGGAPELALEYLRRRWRPVAALFFMQLVPWLDLLHLRARAHLAAAQRARSSTAPWRVRADIRALRRHRHLGFALAYADGLEAGALALAGRQTAAVAALERAAAGFDRCGMELFRESARLWSSRSTGDSAVERSARDWMTSRGVVHPDRVASMLIPGFA